MVQIRYFCESHLSAILFRIAYCQKPIEKGQIRDFLAKAWCESLFVGLIPAKVLSTDDFQDYLVALRSDFCYSYPFLYLFTSNFDPHKGHLKSVCHFSVQGQLTFVPYLRVRNLEFSLQYSRRYWKLLWNPHKVEISAWMIIKAAQKGSFSGTSKGSYSGRLLYCRWSSIRKSSKNMISWRKISWE